MITYMVPAGTDVVVRQKSGDAAPVYLVGTSSSPDQLILRTRDDAVAHALAFAKLEHVRAWFADGGDAFVLLSTFARE